jgi:hypothetical protein
MSTSTRHKLGVTLIAIGILSGIVIANISAMVRGETGDVHRTERFQLSGLNIIITASTYTTYTLPLLWLLPSFALFAAGIVCSAWPSRKPPRLSS